jgi:hypothetical protein
MRIKKIVNFMLIKKKTCVSGKMYPTEALAEKRLSDNKLQAIIFSIRILAVR